MIASPQESYMPTVAPDIAISGAAEARGISLDPERLAQLTGAAERIQYWAGRPDSEKPQTVFWDAHNDVEVDRTTFSDHFGATAAEVNFTPVADSHPDVIVGATSAGPEHATLFASMLIRGMQNYVLLVDAGLIEKPTIVFGNTNPEMAIVAERFGMLSDIARQSPNPSEAHKEMRTVPKMEVSGRFDEVSKRAFSEGTKRFQELLARRLATQQPAGRVVLSSV